MFLLKQLDTNSPLKWEYFGQFKRKCNSSSTEFKLQFLQVLSFMGVFGIVYLPISIWSLWLLVLNLVILTLSLSLLTTDTYFSNLKTLLNNLYVLILSLICSSLDHCFSNLHWKHFRNFNKKLFLRDLDCYRSVIGHFYSEYFWYS